VKLGAFTIRVLAVGGHTLGHVAYVFDDVPLADGTTGTLAFVGDSCSRWAVAGCSRNPVQFWDSLCGSRPCLRPPASIAPTNIPPAMPALPSTPILTTPR
jgi:glyoxylase-like metal-dependent hydrolase (beta-lactamase superfamily II)